MRGKRWLGPSLGAAIIVAVSGCHTAFGPEPIDRNWRVYDGPRVSFFVLPNSFAEQHVARLTEVIEDQYSATVRSLGLSYAGHLHAYAYNSGADAELTSDYSGRAYPETESFRFVAVPPMGDNLLQLMSHEANHVLIIDGLGRAGTYFMTEGLASALLSETFHQSGRHFVFPWTRSHRAQLPKVSTLIDEEGWLHTAEDVAYKTSASFLAWLLDTYGPDRLRQIYPLRSEQMLDRIQSVYGRSLDALEAEWLRFVETWPG
jgi:hypothetical protein